MVEIDFLKASDSSNQLAVFEKWHTELICRVLSGRKIFTQQEGEVMQHLIGKIQPLSDEPSKEEIKKILAIVRQIQSVDNEPCYLMTRKTIFHYGGPLLDNTISNFEYRQGVLLSAIQQEELMDCYQFGKTPENKSVETTFTFTRTGITIPFDNHSYFFKYQPDARTPQDVLRAFDAKYGAICLLIGDQYYGALLPGIINITRRLDAFISVLLDHSEDCNKSIELYFQGTDDVVVAKINRN